jgi:hypothetical protein
MVPDLDTCAEGAAGCLPPSKQAQYLVAFSGSSFTLIDDASR